MANAIITDHFRKSLLSLLETEIKTTNTGKYWIGIGKSDKWTQDSITGTSELVPPAPENSVRHNEDVIHNLIALKKIASDGVTRLVLKSNHTWGTGRVYKVYDPSDLTSFNHDISAGGGITKFGCYVLSGDKIYICLANSGNGVSTINPTGVTSYIAEFSDDYIWVEAGKLQGGVQGLGKFENSTTFEELPARGSDFSNTTWNDTNATAATGGLLYGFKIVNAGEGLPASIQDLALKVRGQTIAGGTFEVNLNGTTDSTGILTGFADSGGNPLELTDFQGYGVGTGGIKYATVDYAQQGNPPVAEPVIVPLIAPPSGFGVGANSNYELFPARYVGLSVDFDTTDSTDVRTDVSFRQISLVYNPTQDSSSSTDGIEDSPPTTDTMDSLGFITTSLLNLNVLDFSGYYLEYQTTGERAWIDSVIPSGGSASKIFFHQNSEEKINLKQLPSTGTFDIFDPDGNSVQTGISATALDETPEHTDDTGTVLFVENRSPIKRSQAQKEEVRLVLQL